MGTRYFTTHIFDGRFRGVSTANFRGRLSSAAKTNNAQRIIAYILDFAHGNGISGFIMPERSKTNFAGLETV